MDPNTLMGALLLVVLVLILIVAKLAVKQGESKAFDARMDGLNAQLTDIKTNDLKHINDDVKALRMEVGGLRNAIWSGMQETIVEIVKKVIGGNCPTHDCPPMQNESEDKKQ